MILAAESVEQLAEAVLELPRCMERADLSRLNRLLEHVPEDMTASAQAGMTLGELQAALRPHNQWVPLDPPSQNQLSIADLLAFDWSGPRRLGYGSAREHVIGMRMVLGSGEIIKAGGKVVKNVAGYDLCRLFIGARHSLGVIVEAVFKLRPLPETETILRMDCPSLEQAERVWRDVRRLAGEPTILDLHNVSGQLAMVLGFAGAREDVEALRTAAEKLGFVEPGHLNYDAARLGWGRESLLPTKVIDRLRSLAGETFVARLGNGIVYWPGASLEPKDMPGELIARVRQTYDPRGVMPEFR